MLGIADPVIAARYSLFPLLPGNNVVHDIRHSRHAQGCARHQPVRITSSEGCPIILDDDLLHHIMIHAGIAKMHRHNFTQRVTGADGIDTLNDGAAALRRGGARVER